MTIARNIKNYEDMSKEDLSIALLKPNESHTEPLKIGDNSNTEIRETIKLFNELRSNFSREEIKKLREKFHQKEEDDNLTKKEELKILRRKLD